MYLSYYNLSKIPFSISPDPNFLWLSEKHSEALATLKYGIFENKGFLVLTGNIGTGKTALINRLIREISVTADYYKYSINYLSLFFIIMIRVSLLKDLPILKVNTGTIRDCLKLGLRLLRIIL